MKRLYQRFINCIKSYYLAEEGGKSVINQKRVKHNFAAVAVLFFLIQVCTSHDDSLIGKSYKPFFESNGSESISVQVLESGRAKELIEQHAQDAKQKGKSVVRSKPILLNYNAKQVIERQAGDGNLTSLPSGTNFIGKLVNGIDTREANQTVRIVLPYGGSHPSGGSIPRDSILLGTASYSEKSDRVYVRFTRVIFPSGDEYKIDAQALSSADYTPGLAGEVHGQSDMRMIGSLGLTMVSAAAEVLTEKTPFGAINPLGQIAVEPRPNLKNAALKGVSEASKEEAGRHAEVAKGQEEYLTINTGGDLIVSLLTPFKGENL